MNEDNSSTYPKKKGWLEAIKEILADGNVWHYVDISNAILEQKLVTKFGANPATTVNSYFTTNLYYLNDLLTM